MSIIGKVPECKFSSAKQILHFISINTASVLLLAGDTSSHSGYLIASTGGVCYRRMSTPRVPPSPLTCPPSWRNRRETTFPPNDRCSQPKRRGRRGRERRKIWKQVCVYTLQLHKNFLPDIKFQPMYFRFNALTFTWVTKALKSKDYRTILCQ